ncbi:hypothetical protein EJB05_36473 [Eragrostis curvula]|uniref:Uncharacterized protein n=1 Tax=Eragrostis curvula TaxID=38414 RepID=A0A5J9UAT1_9POAL|nr:hypothetical protein EJB05_36473 [Eragrostis curvula]
MARRGRLRHGDDGDGEETKVTTAPSCSQRQQAFPLRFELRYPWEAEDQPYCSGGLQGHQSTSCNGSHMSRARRQRGNMPCPVHCKQDLFRANLQKKNKLIINDEAKMGGPSSTMLAGAGQQRPPPVLFLFMSAKRHNQG